MQVNRDYLSFSPLHSLSYTLLAEKTLQLKEAFAKGGIQDGKNISGKRSVKTLTGGKHHH
jgi:hypothetical protein